MKTTNELIQLKRSCLLVAAVCLAGLSMKSQGQGTIQVAISCGANGNISPKGTLTLPVPADLDVTATPNPGFTVEDWYVDGAGTLAGGINQQHFHWLGGIPEHSIYVAFIRISNLVHVTTGPKGTLAPCSSCTFSIGWGDSVTFTATPNAHYHVDTWSLDNQPAQSGSNTFTLSNIQAEHSVAVSFAVDVYTVRATSDPHGTLSPTGAVAITYANNRQFFAAPAPGYDWVVWALDGTPFLTNATSYLLPNVQTNHELHVSFLSPPLSVALTPTNSVLISWPDAINPHTLQESASLNPPVWSNSPASVKLISGRRQATVSPFIGRFYRLSYP